MTRPTTRLLLTTALLLAAQLTCLAAQLTCLAAQLTCLAAPTWLKVKPVGEKKALPKGKTLLKSNSPDGQYVLLLRDEGEHGDFFWRSVYVQHDGVYTLLQTCNELRHPEWSSAPTTVTFETDVATGPNVMERSQVTYTPSTRTFRRRLLKKLKVEGAG